MQLHIDRPNGTKVCVLGGTGFVGQHLVSVLNNEGFRVRVATRRRERHRELLVLPGVDLVQADVHSPSELRRLFSGCGAVVNLVGILNERRRGDFQAAHVKLPRQIVNTCREMGVSRLVHMSALNADAARGTSAYLRSKGEGEDLVHAAEGLEVTSFRPSVIFGPGDHFFNRFATLLHYSPLVFPLACPKARFAPIYVGDVARAMAAALSTRATIGQRYELCGPRAYTLAELIEYISLIIKDISLIVPLPDFVSRLQAHVMGLLPGKPFSYDNYLSMKTASVCSGGFPEIFGITPQTVETIVPGYLLNDNQRGRFTDFRRKARHGY